MLIKHYIDLQTMCDPGKARVLDDPVEMVDLLRMTANIPFRDMFARGYASRGRELHDNMIRGLAEAGVLPAKGLRPMEELQDALTVGDVLCLVHRALEQAEGEDPGNLLWSLSLTYCGRCGHYLREGK